MHIHNERIEFFLSSLQTLYKWCIIYTILKLVSLANVMFLRFSHKFTSVIEPVKYLMTTVDFIPFW